MVRVTVGHSQDPSTRHAVAEVLAHASGSDEGPAAALVFAAMLHDHEAMLAGLQDALGDIPLIGCTTDGELSSGGGFQEDSLVLVLFWDVRVSAGVGQDLHVDVDGAVASAVAAVQGETGLVIALPAGVDTNGSAVVECLARALPKGVTAVGAVAADQWRFDATLQFHGRSVLRHALPILHLQGRFAVGVGVGWGWTPLGTEGVVTAARGHVVERIDASPALAFFRRHFGEEHEPIPQFPLTVALSDGTHTLRAPMSYDAASGSVVMAGDVPVGARVRLSEGNRTQVLDGSHQSVGSALEGCPEPAAVLAFSCAARKHVLGTRTREEGALLQERTGGRPMAGFYGYGEFVIANGHATFYNETLVTVAIGEEA